MELGLLLTALLCWLAYTLYFSALLIRSGRLAVEETVCIYMGSQADVAEWFIRSVCRSEGVLAGRLEIAVAVDCPVDDTGRIVRILSREKEFKLIGGGEWRFSRERKPSGAWVLDVRGMDKKGLSGGPLRIITGYGRKGTYS